MTRPDPLFHPVFRSAIILALLLPAAADEVELADGSKLSGTVTALADGGQVSLDSPLSFEPFQLRAERIKRVDFSSKKASDDEQDALIVLANGDQFPGELTGIDETAVKVQTTFAGEISIPRGSVSTVQLGVRPRKIIYSGPADDSGWTTKNGWRFDSKRFASDSSGTLSRTFDTPGSFSLSFRLSWRNSPNIQVYFADESLETTGKADRYYLQFAGAGFELKRQQSGDGQQYLSMASIPRDPSEFTDSTVKVRLHVDRQLGRVHLYINGAYEGMFADPDDTKPIGRGIMFKSNIGGDDAQFLDNIEIREWDASSERHIKEERGDETKDVLITRSSDRGTGSILSLVAGTDGGTIRYKGPHHPDPVELPVAEVSTLFFAKPAEPQAATRPPLVLGLRGRGSLGVAGCNFAGESITAKHPLLGDLAIRRDAVESLERADGKSEEKEEEDP